jgi:hypothetical protein
MSLSLAPFGDIETKNFLFVLGSLFLGYLYYLMWCYRIRPSERLSKRFDVKAEGRNVSHGARSPKFERLGTGFKEEVYEFMETCVAVKGRLRHVEDPDRGRAHKVHHLVKDEPPLCGRKRADVDPPDYEDTSHSSTSNHNELVELCLGIRKGLNKVQDPDEARKQKLQRLKEIETSRIAAEVTKQHQQAGFSRLWKPAVASTVGSICL